MYIIRDIPFNEVLIIKELWEKNRKYHENISENFANLYSNLIFEERINPFSSLDENHIKVSIAENRNSGELLGYCISTFKGIDGEVHSLHVDENIRNKGIGKMLMEKHIEWMKNNGCKTIMLSVAADNKNTIEFYKTLGFKANTIELRLV